MTTAALRQLQLLPGARELQKLTVGGLGVGVINARGVSIGQTGMAVAISGRSWGRSTCATDAGGREGGKGEDGGTSMDILDVNVSWAAQEGGALMYVFKFLARSGQLAPQAHPDLSVC